MNNEEAANVLRIMASGIELKGYTENWLSGFKEAYEMAINVLEERPTGEWIVENDVYCICPFCNFKDVKYSNYCPDCGAKMKRSDEE